MEYYKTFRPSPLIRAYNLEKELGTPAKIYCKFEGNNTSGSHKLNSAIAQAYYAKKQGLQGLTTETGAGQWGTALSMACTYFDIPLTVYMVKRSYKQKPYRKSIIETYGAEVIPARAIRPRWGVKFWPKTRIRAVPRLRDLRGGGKGRFHARHALCARLGAQPGAPAPVRDRPGGENRPWRSGRISGYRYRLRGRWLEPWRPDRSLYAGPADRQSEPLFHRRGAGLLPIDDARQICL